MHWQANDKTLHLVVSDIARPDRDLVGEDRLDFRQQRSAEGLRRDGGQDDGHIKEVSSFGERNGVVEHHMTLMRPHPEEHLGLVVDESDNAFPGREQTLQPS